MNDRQENTTVYEGTAEQEFTVGNFDSAQTVTEIVVKVKNSRKVF